MRAPRFWYGGGPGAHALSALLSPVGRLYGYSVEWRARTARPWRAAIPVICIGNLTAGGSGKTPVAIAIARMLRGAGQRPVLLTRGYGGKSKGPITVDLACHNAGDVGDEALLLAAHAPVVVARNRAKGAQLAQALGATAIVMDDGLQNFDLAKDLSLVVVDAQSGFGNGALIPAGPLRECVHQGLGRADALILMGEGNTPIPSFPRMLRAGLVPTAPEAVRGREAIAFAGIGRPEKFFTMLTTIGAAVIGTQAFADHHRYSAMELSALRSAAERAHALLVTTEKDYLRIAPDQRHGILSVPVHAAFESDAITGLLDRVLISRQ
jgi:tetraacyldisaccharide 4'-kinase